MFFRLVSSCVRSNGSLRNIVGRSRTRRHRPSFERLENRTVPAVPTILEFPLISGDFPLGITSGPDGNVWFVESGIPGEIGHIGEINPATHAISEFPVGGFPGSIAAGPDGNLWFTEFFGNNIGQISPNTHVITEFAIPGGERSPLGIAAGPDGNLWFLETGTNRIAQINPSTHVINEFDIPTPSSRPDAVQGIVGGPDGNVWFTEAIGNIAEINPTTHAISEFTVPTPQSIPDGITVGPDGNLWFTERVGKIGEIDPSTHAINEFPLPAGFDDLQGITTGQDGSLWFTNDGAGPLEGHIGQFDPTTHVFREFAIPTLGSFANAGITAGPDGNIWFADFRPSKVGEVILSSAHSSGVLLFPPGGGSLANLTATITGTASLLGSNIGTVASNVDFINSLYHTVLGRVADQQGLNGWFLALEAGASRLQVAEGFWQSPEHRDLEVEQFYENLLHRSAVAAERAPWVSALVAGADERDIESAFLNSPEYQAAHANVVSFVIGVFNDVLGRDPNAGELSTWQQNLNGNVSPTAFENFLLRSDEFDRDVVDALYMRVLNRPPDQTGAQGWLGFLENGGSIETAATLFLASDEYYGQAH
jgi:streptogramin lyase